MFSLEDVGDHLLRKVSQEKGARLIGECTTFVVKTHVMLVIQNQNGTCYHVVLL